MNQFFDKRIIPEKTRVGKQVMRKGNEKHALVSPLVRNRIISPMQGLNYSKLA